LGKSSLGFEKGQDLYFSYWLRPRIQSGGLSPQGKRKK